MPGRGGKENHRKKRGKLKKEKVTGKKLGKLKKKKRITGKKELK